MIFRLVRSKTLFSLSFLSILARPLSLLVFFYFLVSSADYANVVFLVFKAKLTNLMACFLLAMSFFMIKTIQIPRSMVYLAAAFLGCMCLSAATSDHPVVCLGFLCFFAFNFVNYFSVPYSLFRFFDPVFLMKLYFYSFYTVGFYALCQLLFSLGGILLPGVSQFIFGIARGQAFAYEPSFYALYMTPFAMYCTTRYILQKPAAGKFGELFWPNLFLLVSTSTGCFFSYLFFLLYVCIFRMTGALNFVQFSIRKLLVKFSLTTAASIAILWCVNQKLVVSGFLKFFYSGIGHFSVQERWRGAMEYWNIFLEHPFLGVGFGAGPFYLAEKTLGISETPEIGILSRLSPTNVTTEILAGLGLLGGSVFLLFFYFLIKTYVATLKISTLTEEERIALIAFALSICVMFSTLQFNQSIMRCYMWTHVGVFCGYANYLKQKHSLSIKVS